MFFHTPAMEALSHPCNKFPIEAAIATRTAPLILARKVTPCAKKRSLQYMNIFIYVIKKVDEIPSIIMLLEQVAFGLILNC